MFDDEMDEKLGVKKKQGFACMTPERRKEIASKGGKSIPPEKRAFSQNAELASAAGKKGGKSIPARKRTFARDHALASRAGKIGGANSHKNRGDRGK